MEDKNTRVLEVTMVWNEGYRRYDLEWYNLFFTDTDELFKTKKLPHCPTTPSVFKGIYKDGENRFKVTIENISKQKEE